MTGETHSFLGAFFFVSVWFVHGKIVSYIETGDVS